MKKKERNVKFNLSKFCITLLLAACNSDSTANYPDKINVESGSTNVVDASSEYTMASTSERQYKRTLQTPWGPRDIYDPAKDPEVKKELDRLDFRMYDESIDKPMFKKFRITKYPTTIFQAEGAVTTRYTGYIPRKDLLEILRSVKD